MTCKCKRAQVIRKDAEGFAAHLQELWVDAEHKQALYECPDTKSQWLRMFPFRHFDLEGPPVFRKLPDFSYYIKRRVELACRCLAISQLAGDQGAEYAKFHLEKQAEDPDACKLKFCCPVTHLNWMMEFPNSRAFPAEEYRSLLKMIK